MQNIDIPQHIAIIMDGNGRWATKHLLPRSAGHKKGAENVRDISLEANKLGVKKLTLYAFSTENWKRPEDEISFLCKLPSLFFKKYIKELMLNNIKVTFIGELEKFPKDTQNAINDAVEKTHDNTGLNLCIAINYGSRREIVLAAKAYCEECLNNERNNDLSEEEFSKYLMDNEYLDVDLLIRTSGELRISNYLLWQIAYSELVFINKSWPEFNEDELNKCIEEYNKRDRRFGGVK